MRPFASVPTPAFRRRASCRIRTNDPEITNHVLWPTELKRQVCTFLRPPKGLIFRFRMQRYAYFFKSPNFSRSFLMISSFFLDFCQFYLQSIHTEVYTLLKCITCLLNENWNSWYAHVHAHIFVQSSSRLDNLKLHLNFLYIIVRL